MFGYVRPEKDYLLMRDFTRYRSIYCGLCMTLKERYGNIKRAAVTYDMTFLALLLLALSKEDSDVERKACFLNPFKKKAMSLNHPALDFSADVTVILAYFSAQDDAQDEKPVQGRIFSLLLKRAAKKAQSIQPQLTAKVSQKMAELDAMEKGDYDLAAADIFGQLLAEVFTTGANILQHPEKDMLIRALAAVGFNMGQWIYLLDAFDDLKSDLHNKQWNPLLGLEESERRELVEQKLIQCEEEIDRILAVLPYERDGAIIGNIATMGLAYTRKRILTGVRLPKV